MFHRNTKKRKSYAYDLVKRRETTKLVLGRKYIFIGDLSYFLANFFATNICTLTIIVVMGVC